MAARERARRRRSPPPSCRHPHAETAGLDVRLAALDKLRAAGRWARLAAELDTIEAEAAAAGQRYRDTAARRRRRCWAGAMSCAACSDSYQVKAGRLGAAEDSELASVLIGEAQ